MREALAILDQLDEEHVQWLMENGTPRELAAEEVLVRAGEAPEHLYLVLNGVLAVGEVAPGEPTLALLGPGELVGEMAFLEGASASATVRAQEAAKVYGISAEALSDRAAQNAGFSTQLYRALGRVVSARLRSTSAQLAAAHDGAGSALRRCREWRELEPVIDGFKELMAHVEGEAKKHGEVPPELKTQAGQGFDVLTRALNDTLGDAAGIDPGRRREIGSTVRREVLPYMLLTRTVERIYTKPRGYAGDYQTIQWMYEMEPGGVPPLGPLIDELFLERPAAVAVRNRRGLLAEEIRAAVQRADGAAKVTSLACGPAEEIFDVFALPDLTDKLSATLIDIDFQALARVSDRKDMTRLGKKVRLEQGNLVYLALGRAEITLQPQDLIYSIGLIDYFQDKFVVALLNWIHGKLRHGGRVVLGNFHPKNPDKALMDHVLDWELIHRSEDDMNRLYRASSFGKPCDELRFEEQGVNLFAVGVKD